MRRLLLAFVVLLSLVPTVAFAQASSPCQFVLGFQAVYSLIPSTVGGCVDDEQHNPANGDALQQTAKGLLVWRKADNFTAFTDGFRSWVNGPSGIQERLNSQRFAWEANPSGLAVVAGDGVAATSAPAISASLSSGMTRLSALIGTSLDWTAIDAAFQTTVDDAYAAPLIPLAGTSEDVIAPANSAYLLIFTTTRNVGSVALPMDVGFGIAVVDSQGNRYKSDITGTVYAQQLYQYMDEIISLQPNQAARSTTAYIVPSGASGFQMAAVYAPIPSLAPPAPLAPPVAPPSPPMSSGGSSVGSSGYQPAPTAPSGQYPADVTAVCSDGSYSYSAHRSGTCSHHGGVNVWVNRPPS